MDISLFSFDQHKKQVEDIFFKTSSKKSFSSLKEKQSFLNKWMSYYYENCLNEFFVAKNNNTVLAYLTGCSNSTKALNFYGPNTPYALFSDLFFKFPAHLHINALPTNQGLGVGSKLITHYKKILANNDVTGLHIITSPSARNVGFYKKNGFTYTEKRLWKTTPLLFMACSIP